MTTPAETRLTLAARFAAAWTQALMICPDGIFVKTLTVDEMAEKANRLGLDMADALIAAVGAGEGHGLHYRIADVVNLIAAARKLAEIPACSVECEVARRAYGRSCTCGHHDAAQAVIRAAEVLK